MQLTRLASCTHGSAAYWHMCGLRCSLVACITGSSQSMFLLHIGSNSLLLSALAAACSLRTGISSWVTVANRHARHMQHGLLLLLEIGIYWESCMTSWPCRSYNNCQNCGSKASDGPPVERCRCARVKSVPGLQLLLVHPAQPLRQLQNTLSHQGELKAHTANVGINVLDLTGQGQALTDTSPTQHKT